MTTLAQWLAADQTRVTEVLRRRPDVEQPTSPATVDELANRLQTPGSLAALAGELPRPHLQAMEAVQAFGLGASRAELTALLARSGPDHEAMVAAVLDDLVDCAVIWPATQDRLQIAWGVGHLWPHPLGLGASVVELLAAKNVHELRQLALRQGLRTPPTRRADLQQAVADKLSDPSWVREQVDQAVPEVASAIIALAQPGAAERTAQEREELYHQLRRGRRGSEAYEAFAARQAAYQWAAALGLMLGPQYGHELYMPAEVGLALRGDGFRAPFEPRRPIVLPLPVDPARVTSGSASAVTAFHQQALAVLDVVARQELVLAKSGGLAIRDLTRLAKTAVVEPVAARITLEIAEAAGLITTDTGVISTTRQFQRWRSEEAPRRYAELLHAWWRLPFAPSEAEDLDGKALRPLFQPTFELNGDLARQLVLVELWNQPEGQGFDLEALQTVLLWDRPILEHVYPSAVRATRQAWVEAELLGVIALGALTELGRAVPESKPPELVSLLTSLLPASSDSAIFGSDLTVMVLGSPTARVSRLLDSAATRESRGAGITWRFSRDTVRGVLDAGTDAAQLEADLAAIATGELPQPLRYLINDIARRHGELRVSGAVSVIRGDDVARVAEAVADRSLRTLGLLLVAPTVLTSQQPADVTLTALRKAGYFPMPET